MVRPSNIKSPTPRSKPHSQHPGRRIDHDDLAGVAVTDGAVDETVVLNVTGVYELAKGSGAITQGQKVYAAADGSGIVATATDNKPVGIAWEAAAAADTTVLVKLNV